MVKVNTVEERPGGAANVAMNIASLGANARLVGLTGIDDAAARAEQNAGGGQCEVRLRFCADASDDYQTARTIT
ncbi:ADP-heptose synthase [Salmonella enterica subsp. enterica]|uniref:ADP-heptose synthase n=1 Tax=Salmonella enterica I TaxID=59201 RepID=A0A447TV60_SALET|nr:ADP-heptose synthase [Salmonella enterica subsp. enterica]